MNTETKLINLTGRTLSVNGETLLAIGANITIDITTRNVGGLAGIPVHVESGAKVMVNELYFPAVQPDVVYIVNHHVAKALFDRPDVLAPICGDATDVTVVTAFRNCGTWQDMTDVNVPRPRLFNHQVEQPQRGE